MAAHVVNNVKEFEGYLNKQVEDGNEYLIIINFCASWSESSQHMNNVFHQLAKNFPSHNFYQIDAEEVEDIAERFEITRVPSFLFLKGGKEIENSRITGANAPALSKKVEELTSQFGNKKPSKDPVEALNERLKKLVNYAPIMLFMKGTPDVPQCGFSRKIVEILKKNKVKFCSFNIMSDDEVRQGLKTFSNWQTYPQLYVKGELIGGLDIVAELDEENELMNSLAPGLESAEDSKKKLNERLKKLIESDQVMLFIKGSPDRPQCGFSNKIISLLNNQKIKFSHFNILNDEEVRQGLKEYSNWPTYPQLYAKGELVGGLDIVTELAENGELLIPPSHILSA